MLGTLIAPASGRIGKGTTSVVPRRFDRDRHRLSFVVPSTAGAPAAADEEPGVRLHRHRSHVENEREDLKACTIVEERRFSAARVGRMTVGFSPGVLNDFDFQRRKRHAVKPFIQRE